MVMCPTNEPLHFTPGPEKADHADQAGARNGKWSKYLATKNSDIRLGVVIIQPAPQSPHPAACTPQLHTAPLGQGSLGSADMRPESPIREREARIIFR